MEGRRIAWQGADEEIDLCGQIFDRADPVPARRMLWAAGKIAHRHVEACSTPADRLPHSAEPHDSDMLAAQHRAARQPGPPSARPGHRIGAGNVAHNSDKQPECVIGDDRRVEAGGMRDQDAAIPAGLEIDAFIAGADRADQPQFRQGRDVVSRGAGASGGDQYIDSG